MTNWLRTWLLSKPYIIKVLVKGQKLCPLILITEEEHIAACWENSYPPKLILESLAFWFCPLCLLPIPLWIQSLPFQSLLTQYTSTSYSPSNKCLPVSSSPRSIFILLTHFQFLNSDILPSKEILDIRLESSKETFSRISRLYS